MKIDISKIKQIPKEISDKFGMCFYGPMSEEIKSWIEFHGMTFQNMGNYTNIYTDKNMYDLFNKSEKFKYMDGFSPNLNKHLHIGHFSNLVLAKAFKSLDIAEKTVAILGDTLEGEVGKEEALQSYNDICSVFDYPVDLMFMASEMKCDESIMSDGVGDMYSGTKVFADVSEVGLKSNGKTTYFYQDVALAQKLNAPTIYLTGSEQVNHFNKLKKMFSHIHHVGLGLVLTYGSKMSSRHGNVLWMKDIFDMLMENFKNEKLCYNVFAGFILKSVPKSNKNINMDQLENPLNSPGLYLSYTLAKLKSAGVECKKGDSFISQDLQFNHIKSINSCMPNILLEGLINHAKKISGLYVTHKIKGDEKNKEMFEKLGSDLSLGMNLLGLFEIDKV